jgi:hypothetical protein
MASCNVRLDALFLDEETLEIALDTLAASIRWAN